MCCVSRPPLTRARTARVDLKSADRVTDAVRDYEREQLVLHDTAAVTLTIVGHENKLPPQQRLAT